jgi:hypothetical protein
MAASLVLTRLTSTSSLAPSSACYTVPMNDRPPRLACGCIPNQALCPEAARLAAAITRAYYAAHQDGDWEALWQARVALREHWAAPIEPRPSLWHRLLRFLRVR